MQVKSIFFFLCCSVGLLACTPVVQEPKKISVDPEKILTSYFWQYQPPNENPPIKLIFENNSVGVNTGCNAGGAPYKIQGKKLIATEDFMLTAMGCSDELAKQEVLATNLFDQDKQAIFTLDSTNIAQPTLTFKMLDSQQYSFVGKMTPETKYQSKPEILTFEIFPHFVSCENNSAASDRPQCLKIREIKEVGLWENREKGQWQIIKQDQIEDYQHIENTYAMILVKRFPLKDHKRPYVDVYYTTPRSGNGDYYEP